MRRVPIDLSGTATETIRLTQSGVRFSRTDVFKMDGATGLGRTSGTVYRVTGENVITLTGSGLQVTFHTTRDPLGNFHAAAFETHLDCF